MLTADAAAPHPAPAIRVLVVDDTAPVRRLLVRRLTRAGHTVVGEAATAADGVAAALALRPDVVLLDLQLPDGRGTDAAARLLAAARGAAGAAPPEGVAVDGGRARGAVPAVVLWTGDVAGAWAAGAAGCGARAVLDKTAPLAEVDAAVRAAARARAA